MDLAGDIDVILSTSNGSFTVMKASDLLPHPFGGENLKNVRRTRR
jgi:cytidine deaminase